MWFLPLVLTLWFPWVLEPMHEPHGKCHRPDKDVCRHRCHHQFCNCGRGCKFRCELDKKDPYCWNKCIMDCFGQHARCSERCREERPSVWGFR